MIFAHYMPCFHAYGYSPDNNYWWNAPSRPRKARRVGDGAADYLSDDLADSDLSAMVWDMRIAKEYGLERLSRRRTLDGDKDSGLNYRNTWRMLLKAAEIVGDSRSASCLTMRPCTNPTEALNEESDQSVVDIGKQSPALLTYDGKPVVFPYADAFPDGRYKNNDLISADDKRDLIDPLKAQGDDIAYAPCSGVDCRCIMSATPRTRCKDSKPMPSRRYFQPNGAR